MNGTHSPPLVVLSVLVAIVASYAALDLANSVNLARGRARYAWLAGGALAMGTGIWSMHFIGMLAFRLPGTAIAYDVPGLLLSVLVAVGASAFALAVVSRRAVSVPTLAAASLVMGAAIVGMHYVGMASMRMPARIEWSAPLVAASGAIAIAASFAALALAFRYRTDVTPHAHRVRLAGGVVEGFAIAGMHYTAMAAARFVPLPGGTRIGAEDVLATSGLAVAVTGTTLLVLAIALSGSVVGRELGRRRTLAEDAEQARDAAEDAHRRLAMVQSITDAALARLDVDELFHELLRRICQALACDSATLLLLSEDRRSLVVRASLGMEATAAERVEIPVGKGIAGWIAQHGEPLIVPDTRAVDVYSPAVRNHVRSLIGAPLVVEDRPIGVLHLGTAEPRDFTPEDLELLRLVAGRSAYALERARLYEAAMAASRAKSEFLASVSHELRTPLNAILGYVDLLELGVGTEAQRVQYLPRVRASGQHLLGVINDILDLARIESGGFRVESTRGSLAEVAAEAVALVEPMAAQKGIELRSACDAERAPFHGDATRVRQVLVNLLSNAVKFTDAPGRVTVACGVTREPDPGAGLPDGAAWSFVRVEDTGIGIAAADLEAVFHPFMQVDGSLTRSQGGTGLGLTISRQLARRMGGEVTVSSEPGAGSRFTLWLPAAPETPWAGEPAPARRADDVPLARAGSALQGEVPAIMAALNRRFREEPPAPAALRLSDAELEDHQATLLSDVAQTLIVIGETGGEPELLRDGSDVQQLVAERHGAQRARLGWTEEGLEAEFAMLREEVEAALLRSAAGLSEAETRRALDVVERLLWRARGLSADGLREELAGRGAPR